MFWRDWRRFKAVAVGVCFWPFCWRLERWNFGEQHTLCVGPFQLMVVWPKPAPVVFEQTADGLGAYLDRYDNAAVACRCGWSGPAKHLVTLDDGKVCPECGLPFAAWELPGWRDGKRVEVTETDMGTYGDTRWPSVLRSALRDFIDGDDGERGHGG